MWFLGGSRVVESGYSDLWDLVVVRHRMMAQNPRSIADLQCMDAHTPPAFPITATDAGVDRLDSSPLTEIQMRMLGSSVQTAKPIRKAAGYARASGWMTLFAGGLSVFFSLGSFPGMVLGILLAGIGMRELGLARRLDALDLRAPSQLAINQLALGGALIMYAIWKIAIYDSANSVLAGSLASDPTIASMPEMAGTIEQLGQIEYLLSIGVSAVLIVCAFVMQGGTALYYWRKKKKILSLHRHSPGWVLRVHQVMSDPKSSDSIQRAA